MWEVVEEDMTVGNCLQELMLGHENHCERNSAHMQLCCLSPRKTSILSSESVTSSHNHLPLNQVALSWL